MKKSTKRTYILVVTIVLVVLILAFGIIRESGYVLSGPYFVRGGVLEITDARPNSDVFIDNRRAGRVNETGFSTFDGLALGERNVIVSSEGTWPWIFDFVSTSGQTTTLTPLQVRESTVGTPLLGEENPEYNKAVSLFAEYREPTRATPITHDESSVWVEGTSIFARLAATDSRIVYSSPHPIRNVFWFGDRNDVIVVANQHNVFALDLRESSVQNFQPIYTGSEPFAVANPDDARSIFVREGEQYLLVEL